MYAKYSRVTLKIPLDHAYPCADQYCNAGDCDHGKPLKIVLSTQPLTLRWHSS